MKKQFGEVKKEFGFCPPIKSEKDYVFGSFLSLPKVVLQENANWAEYLPMYENQSTSIFETYGCTVFGTLNCLETIMNKLYGVEFNFSERYNYNLVNLEAPGSDPKTIANSIHKFGVLEQKELPFTDNLMSFRSPRPMTQSYINKGQEWLSKYKFGYEWVYEGKVDKKALKECLQYSPIGISVDAWYKNDKGRYYSPKGQNNNHWTVLYGINPDGEYLVFDTYDNGFKILTADHNIQYAMRYNVSVLPTDAQKKSWLSQILDVLKSILLIDQQILKKNDIEEMEYIPLKPMENPTNDLDLFCTAIRDYEGKPGDRNYRNNNPGNCKYNPTGYLAKYGVVKKDKGGFAIFETYEKGWMYLQNMILEHRKKNPTQSIANYMKKYAPSSDNNDPVAYATYIGKKMGINPFTFTLGDMVVS